MTSTTPSVDDVITAEVIRGALLVAAEEASIVVVRAAHSTFIQEGADACAAILDADAQLVALSTATSLMHAASLRCSLPALIEDIPLATMRPGDVFAMNDPYRGGIHANDILVFRPVFAGDRVRFFAGTLIHVADVGGVSAGGLAALATDTFAEGLMLPPVHLYRQGEPARDVLRIIEGNSRTPDKAIGDVHALVAGVNVIGRRLDELVERYGAGRARAIHAGWLDGSERRMRDELRRLPAGTYHGSFTIEGDGFVEGRRYEVHAAVTLGRRRDRRRLRRHVAAVGRRDQRVVLADHVGRDLRGALLRRPEHPDERRLLPRGDDAAPTRDARQPEPAGRVRRARHQRDRGDRGDARRPRAGASRPSRRAERARSTCTRSPESTPTVAGG